MFTFLNEFNQLFLRGGWGYSSFSFDFPRKSAVLTAKVSISARATLAKILRKYLHYFCVIFNLASINYSN